MSDVLAVKPQNPVLAWGTATGVVLLALGGFVLSFNALTDLAVHSGIMSELAFIWPLIVDGFIVVATASAFALKSRGRTVTWYPWTALIIFSAVSVAGNASHAVNADNVSVPVWIATIVSSIPAVALLIASHLLVVMIDVKRSPRPTVRKSGVTSKKPVTASPTGPGTPLTASTVAPLRMRDEAQMAAPRLRAVESPVARQRPVALVDQLTAAAGRGESITAALVAHIEGVSDRTGRRRITELRESNPELFEAESVQGFAR